MMNVKEIRSDIVYAEIMNAETEKKNDIYRYQLMRPFEKKWSCIHVPLKAAVPGGYDVIMASGMLGFALPTDIDETQKKNIELIGDRKLWEACTESIQKSLDCFAQAGIQLPVQEYLYTILLANPDSPYIRLSDGYCGDGGIPGYIFASLVPNAFTMKRLPAALAHETNHNVRFQFIEWKNDVTLAEMMVNEGLAENFAVHLYGVENAGPWVTKTDMQTLKEKVKPVIRKGLDVQGLQNLNAYLYGDEIALAQNCEPVGLPYCAGYACGYHMVRHYLEKTGISIVDATILPADEILANVEDFWEE